MANTPSSIGASRRRIGVIVATLFIAATLLSMGLVNNYYTVPGIGSSLSSSSLFQSADAAKPVGGSSGISFTQCQNGDPADVDFGTCQWINGILNAEHTDLHEGMSTTQKMIIKNVAGGAKYIKFDIDYTKAGIHAFDFATTFDPHIVDQTSNPVLDSKAFTAAESGSDGAFQQGVTDTVQYELEEYIFRSCSDFGSFYTEANCKTLLNTSNRYYISFPYDNFVSNNAGSSTANKLKELAFESASNQGTPGVSPPDANHADRYLTIYVKGGTLSGGSITLQHATSGGAAIANNGDTGDSSVFYDVRFTLSGCSPTCDVWASFGAHLAISGSANTGQSWGAGRGASFISGGSYHVGGIDVGSVGNNGSLTSEVKGSRDNQIMSNAVTAPPIQGAITIVKVTQPSEATGVSFAFTQNFKNTDGTAASPSPFFLDTDTTTTTISNQITFAVLAGQTYAVSEDLSQAPGWSLKASGGRACVESGGTTNSGPDGTDPTKINITVEDGEQITCTFTDVKPDAYITVSPLQDTNGVGESHTITVSVFQSTDQAGVFTAAPNGTKPTVTLTPNPVVTLSNVVDNCATTGTVSGQCTVTFTSNAATVVTIHATVTLTVNGVELTRATGDSQSQDSADATKEFIDGVLTWQKVNNAGGLLGGAVFTVCQTTSYNSTSATFDDITDICVDVTDDTDSVDGPAAAGNDQDGTGGEFKLTGLALGNYTVTEKTAPAGYEKDSTTQNGSLYPGQTTDNISVSFVNNRPIVKLTGFGYDNAATGTPTEGIVNGTTTYAIKTHNYGLADTDVTVTLVITGPTPAGGSVVVSSTGGATGVSAGDNCAAGCTFTWTFNLDGQTAGNTDDSLLNPAIAYNNVADGSKIQADLTVSYTTNGLARQASGSPASISFTIQSE